MSWLSLSLPNPFKSQEENQQNLSEKEEESPSHGGGVTEDLSELGKTITRQIWGLSSFLSPPPDTDTDTTTTIDSVPSDSSSQTLLGIRNDFAEIGGRFKSGISLLSTNKAVNEISRLASNLLQFQKEDEGDDESSGRRDVGVTEEVLAFVKEISMQSNYWIDFLVSLDNNDFDMSDVQREHASTVERLVPSLGALRVKLCPSHMNEEHFWMIYFVLLHPRLNVHDSELLSTPQILEARDVLLQKLQNTPNTQLQTSKSADDLSVEPSRKDGDIQEETSPVQENEIMAKSVNVTNLEDADVDQWLEEDDETGTSIDARKQFGHEQDVSFSDLEDDDNDTPSRQQLSSSVQNVQVSSPNGSSGWVQLSETSDTGSDRKKSVRPNSQERESEGEESNEWLTIDNSDSDGVVTA